MTEKERILASAEDELASRVRAAQISFRQKETDRQKRIAGLPEARARLAYIGMCLDRRALGMSINPQVKEIAGERNAALFTMSVSELEAEQEKTEKLIDELESAAPAGAEEEASGRYYCSVCRDEGYVTDANGIARRCVCFKEIFADKIKEASGLPEGEYELTAPAAGLYPETADRSRYGIPDSPRANAEKAYELARGFISASGPSAKKILFITGAVGVGKTHLACCVGNEAAKKSLYVVYSGIAAVLDALQNRFFNSEESQELYENRREFIETCDVLIIDDLGVENVTDKRYESLISLIDRRTACGLKTVITSNYGLAEIGNVYGERLASRFADRKNSLSLRLAGDDIRLIKNIGKHNFEKQ
ncbi:MAG: ATP-binding protein [Clostridia bacterium]|nr:ATP-binding protein [Clostridia bacterium]